MANIRCLAKALFSQSTVNGAFIKATTNEPMSENKLDNKDGEASEEETVKQGCKDELASHHKSKAIECTKEAQKDSFVNGALDTDSHQELIIGEWNDFESEVVKKHDLNNKTPAMVNWRNSKKDHNLDEVRNSLKKILSKAEDKDGESKRALTEALDVQKLVNLMDNMLKVCRCVAPLHLHHRLEFKHCKGMAMMVASLTGEQHFNFDSSLD